MDDKSNEDGVREFQRRMMVKMTKIAEVVGGKVMPYSECRIERQDGSLIRTDDIDDMVVEYAFRLDGDTRIAKRRDATTTFVLADDPAGCLPSNVEFPNAKSGEE
jgi:hypothetical protein